MSGSFAGGVDGNERLTGTTAAVLVVLLAVELVTVLSLSTLLSTHLFVGVLLIPPVLVKLGSTLYRFARYYGRSAAYRERGAPPLLLRLLGPLVVISTVALFGSGVGMLIAGRQGAGILRSVHSLSFIAFAACCGIHVLAHLRRVPALAIADSQREARLAGARARRALVAGSLALGVGLAWLAVGFDGSWVHHHHGFDDRRGVASTRRA